MRTLATLFALATVAFATPAAADLLVGVDADAAIPTEEGDVGLGGAIRLGWQLDLAAIRLAPEVGAAFHRFPAPSETLGPPMFVRGFGGARVGLGSVVEPIAYAHVGWAATETPVAAGAPEGVEPVNASGAFVEGGAGLELTVLPILDLGVHAGYLQELRDDAAGGLVLAGLHVNLVF